MAIPEGPAWQAVEAEFFGERPLDIYFCNNDACGATYSMQNLETCLSLQKIDVKYPKA